MPPKKTTQRKTTAKKTPTTSSDPSKPKSGDKCVMGDDNDVKVRLGSPAEGGYVYAPVCEAHEKAYYAGNNEVRQAVANAG